MERYLERKEAREKERQEERDEHYSFWTMLAPALRRLPAERQAKLKVQLNLHEVW